jgi:hypothetical protein
MAAQAGRSEFGVLSFEKGTLKYEDAATSRRRPSQVGEFFWN